MSDDITKDVFNGIAFITLNRSEDLNAFTSQMLLDLATLIDQCNVDQNIQAIVLTGRGKFFTSGNDQSNDYILITKFSLT